MRISVCVWISAALLVGCSRSPSHKGPSSGASSDAPAATPSDGAHQAPPPGQGEAVAVFAGGCFWCMEKPFESVEGVREVASGYTGGHVASPTYEQVSSGGTGHVEAVRIVYDPQRVDYARLLRVFVHNIDPTQDDGQFCDRGEQYRSAVFVENAEQRALAAQALAAAQKALGKDVVTEVRQAAPFYLAEDYHQDFYKKSALRYASYRAGCGRDARLEALWGAEAGH